MQHKEVVEKYNGSLEELANDIGNLRYDALNKFLMHLANKLHADSCKDFDNSRFKLAHELKQSAYYIGLSNTYIKDAWKISAPYTNINKPL